MKHVSEATIRELRNIFTSIQDILLKENEHNWRQGIQAIQILLNDAEKNEHDREKAYISAGQLYKNMHGGQGSFSDFMVWRDDEQERKKENHKFSSLADRAWKLLDL